MLLRISNVSKTYQGASGVVRALDDVSLSLDCGQFKAVQGPSGCGKSTLLLVAGGLLAPDGGEILLVGENPYQMSADRRAHFRATTLGFVFQQFHLIPYLSVLDNVLVPTIASVTPDARQRARELIVHFGLEHREQHVPGQLSTGERQRTALARALLNRPRVLLADEPTGNLDRQNADAVLGYLSEFARDGGAVLLVTHDPVAAEVAQEVTHIADGRLVDR